MTVVKGHSSESLRLSDIVCKYHNPKGQDKYLFRMAKPAVAKMNASGVWAGSTLPSLPPGVTSGSSRTGSLPVVAPGAGATWSPLPLPHVAGDQLWIMTSHGSRVLADTDWTRTCRLGVVDRVE